MVRPVRQWLRVLGCVELRGMHGVCDTRVGCWLFRWWWLLAGVRVGMLPPVKGGRGVGDEEE